MGVGVGAAKAGGAPVVAAVGAAIGVGAAVAVGVAVEVGDGVGDIVDGGGLAGGGPGAGVVGADEFDFDAAGLQEGYFAEVGDVAAAGDGCAKHSGVGLDGGVEVGD